MDDNQKEIIKHIIDKIGKGINKAQAEELIKVIVREKSRE